MLKPGKNGAVRTRVTADPARVRDLCHRYAAGLYQQAFLTIGDPASAEHVVRDVLADECALAPVAEDDTRYRLAESVFRHCEQLAADPAWRGCRPASPPAGDTDPDGLLSERERGALGLVLVGGLGYVRASGVLGICPRDMAALLRAALLRLAAASAAVEDGSQVSGLAYAGRGPAEEQEKCGAETRIRHDGGGRSRVRGAGGEVGPRRAAVPGDEEDVTTVGNRGPVPYTESAITALMARGQWLVIDLSALDFME